MLLGLFAAGIGLNIQHDGGHRAYSSRPWVNRLMAMTLELIGGSSYLWRWKHGVFHHTYVNVDGHDTDIDLAPLARLTPHQPRLAIPSVAAPVSLAALRAAGDQVAVLRRLPQDRHRTRQAPARPAAPRDGISVIFVAGKVVFFTLAFGIPLLFHSLGAVLCFYVISGLVIGFLLSVVFQVAHCVEEAEFPVPHEETGSHRARVGGPPGRDQRELLPAQPRRCPGSSAG